MTAYGATDPVTHQTYKTGDIQSDVYDQLGDLIHQTDRSNATHAYTYDAMGRELTDFAVPITSAGNGSQDSAVTERLYSYDVFGRIIDAQTKAGASSIIPSAGTVTSDDQFVYDGLGNLTDEFQDHSGAIPSGTTYASNSSNIPDVHYDYSTSFSGGFNYSRVVDEIYPNGRQLNYNYNGNSGLDGAVGRLSSISDGGGSTAGQVLESYTYLGLNTVVSETLPQENVEMSYLKTDAGSSALGNPNTGEYDAGPDDPYTGLDRFGRVIDQNWFTIGGATIARDQYAYDADSNILYDDNLGPTSTLQAESELYGANGSTAANAYDGLNRVTTFNSGTLGTAGSANRLDTISGGLTSTPTWAMNSQGVYQRSDINAATNQPTFQGVYAYTEMQAMMLHASYTPTVSTINGTPGNAITIGSLSVQYDAWGDLTDLQQWSTTFTVRNTYIISSEGTLVTVPGVIATSQPPHDAAYKYDALGNRISEGDTQLYYDAAGNVIEERSSTTATTAGTQYVWSPAGGNHLVLRDSNASSGSLGVSGSGLGQRLYSLHDGQNNVIAIYAAATNSVVERYMYTPGGQVTVLDLNGNIIGGNSFASAYNWRYTYQSARDDGGGIYDLNGTEINSLTGLPLKEDPEDYAGAQIGYNDAVIAASEESDDAVRQSYAAVAAPSGWRSFVPFYGSGTALVNNLSLIPYDFEHNDWTGAALMVGGDVFGGIGNGTNFALDSMLVGSVAGSVERTVVRGVSQAIADGVFEDTGAAIGGYARGFANTTGEMLGAFGSGFARGHGAPVGSFAFMGGNGAAIRLFRGVQMGLAELSSFQVVRAAASSEEMGVQLGRQFLTQESGLGLSETNWVNPFESASGRGKGVDDVLQDADSGYWIVEYKGGLNAALDAETGQMGENWVRTKIQELIDAKSPWGTILQDAYRSQNLRGITVWTPSPQTPTQVLKLRAYNIGM